MLRHQLLNNNNNNNLWELSKTCEHTLVRVYESFIKQLATNWLHHIDGKMGNQIAIGEHKSEMLQDKV